MSRALSRRSSAASCVAFVRRLCRRERVGAPKGCQGDADADGDYNIRLFWVGPLAFYP